jgi:hypothetical protein
VVNEHILRDLAYAAVHGKAALAAVFDCNGADGVEVHAVADGVPFVFGEVMVIVGVHESVFALGERYAAEGVAVAQAAIDKHRQDGDFFKPVWDFDFENELDDFLTPADG